MSDKSYELNDFSRTRSVWERDKYEVYGVRKQGKYIWYSSAIANAYFPSWVAAARATEAKMNISRGGWKARHSWISDDEKYTLLKTKGGWLLYNDDYPGSAVRDKPFSSRRSAIRYINKLEAYGGPLYEQAKSLGIDLQKMFSEA